MKSFLTFLYAISLTISLFAQAGCTDPQATNYDEDAVENDGSCVYLPTEIIPQLQTNLAEELEELSAMISYNHRIFGLADSGNPTAIYEFDTITGNIIQTKNLLGTDNIDWESMTIDDAYVYVGDTGNNKHGNRTDLVIYRFPIGALDQSGDVPSNQIDRIFYKYEDQTNFSQLPKNTTRFDCESIVSLGDSLYLFTKDWKKFNTRSYSIPKVPGNHTALLHDSLSVNGIVTDVTTSGDSMVVLLGSSLFGNSFLMMLFDYEGQDVFGGNKRQIKVINSILGQPESLTLNDDFSGFIGTESFKKNGMEEKQAIFRYDIHEYLQTPVVSIEPLIVATPKIKIFPNPIKSGKLSFQVPPSLNAKALELIWLNADGHILDITQVIAPKKDTVMTYNPPRLTQSGQHYLLIQAGKEKYIGTVQVLK